jgi:hypothetical protein
MDGLDVLFEKFNWLLKPGGSIFIAVPNQNMIEFNELNGALLESCYSSTTFAQQDIQSKRVRQSMGFDAAPRPLR